MEQIDEDQPTFQFDLVGSDQLWRVGAAVLGLSLWAQLFWYPLSAEFLSAQPSLLFVGLYLLPTLVLFVSLLAEGGRGFLFFVPASTIPGLVLLPAQDVGAILEPHRAIFAVGTLICFLLAGALSARPSRERPEEIESIEEPPRQVAGVYRYYFAVRFCVALVLFGVLVLTPLFDANVTSAIAEHHGEGRGAAQIFLVVFGFFTWSVVAYTMFLLPAANLEYDVRRCSREIDAWLDDAGVIRWRLGIGVGLGVIVIGLIIAAQSPF